MRAAFPLVFGGVLITLGHVTAGAVLGVVGVAVAALSWRRPPAWRRVERGIDRLADLVATTVLTVLGGAVLLLATVVLCLIGHDPIRARKGFAEVQPPTSPRRTFTRQARGSVAGSSVLRGIVLAAVVIGTLIVVIDRKTTSPPTIGLPITPYAHDDEPFAEELFRNQNGQFMAWDPRIGSHSGTYRSRYVNTDGYERRSYVPADPKLVVWFFGGSTMYGAGQRDEHTIPSVIARLSERDGLPVRAVNYGQAGALLWQEVALYQLLLAQGEPPPDLAVFYDGYNDVVSFCLTLARGERPDGTRTLVSAPPAPEKPVVDCLAAPEARGRELGAQLGREFRAAVRAADLPVVHYWQPYPALKRPSPADAPLRRRLGLGKQPALDSSRVKLAAAAAAEMDPPVVDLSHSLDDVDEPVFWDFVHSNELGARLVATAMYADLRPRLALLEP